MEKLDVQEISHAEDVITKFKHRAEEVVNLMFGDHYKIETHGDTFLSDDKKIVIHYYWDGYDAEPFDNCSLVFPFEWVNKSFEELKEIKPKYWKEVERLNKEKEERMQREQAEAERIQKEIDEQKEREEYERLKTKFEGNA